MSFIKKKNRKSSIDEVLPVLSIESDRLIMKDGRVCIGYEVFGAEMEKWNDHNYTSFGVNLEGALKGLPDHSLVQKIDIYYNRRYEKEKNGGYFENRNNNHFLERPMLFHRSFLFIISPSNRNVKANPVNSYFTFRKVLIKDPLNNLDKRQEQLEKNTKGFIECINANADINCKRLKDSELETLYWQFMNMEFDGNPGKPYKAMENNGNYLAVGDKKVNVISLQEQSKEVDHYTVNEYGVSSPFTYPVGLHLQFPHITVTSYWIEDTDKEVKRLDRERQINGSLGGVASQDHEIKEAELSEFTGDIRANKKRLVSLSLQVIITTLGEQARQQNIRSAINAIRSMNGAEGMVETYDNANIFFSCLPGAAANGYRWLLMPSDVASCYMNFTSSYRGNDQGDYICDRFRNPVYINLFDRQLNNQNCIVIGPSGSGKSFTIGHFIVQRQEKNQRQIIIDVGGTYKNIIAALGGEYFEYDPENPIEFNPFLCEKTEGTYTPSNDKINFIIAVLAKLWKSNQLSKAEWAVFLRLLPEYYQQEKELPSLRRFWIWLGNKHKENDKELLEIAKFFDIKEFLVVLEPFVIGKYTELLNSSHHKDISDHKLVCFDMARIKDDEILYPVVTMLLTEMALDVIRKYPDDIKYMYMDEAWSMLSDSMGAFVESMFRTLRKNNGSMTIITQGIDEIIQSTVGTAIINNAETKIILNHTDKENVVKLGKHLGFTHHELDKINSIRVNEKCREVFIKQGMNSNVFTLEVSDHEHAVLTSNPVERNHLKKLMDHYQTLPFAIEQWVEDKNDGVFFNK